MELYKQLFKSWYQYLEEFLSKEYFQKLFLFLDESYKQKLIYPDKKNVFKTFQITNFNDLRVVLIGDNPYQGNKATGLAFANEDNIRESTFSPSLLKIKDCIERTVYNNLYLNFDPTLENWSEQGILLLNTSLTVEAGKIGSHSKYWDRFIKKIISIINENKTGIIFCIWSEQAKQYKDLINDNIHYILEYMNPEYAVKQNIDWNCPHFNEINNIIKNNNGKEFCIEW